MLRNQDYTDRELLHVVNDVGGQGYASVKEIADRLGFTERSQVQAVATRMAWMVRYKYVTKHATEGGYRLSKEGRTLMEGAISPEVEQALAEMKQGDRVVVMRSIASHGFANGSQAGQHMLRREYLHQYANRRRRK